MAQKLDPWKSTEISDYSKLFEEFGIQPFAEVLDALPDPHKYMKRGIVFGHRGYEMIADAIKNKKPFVILDGFMPTGKAHFGHKMVMDQIVWYQKQGGIVVVGMADCEAHAVRGLSWEECRQIGVEEYITSLIALGLQPENTRIYFQSECQPVKDLAFELGTKVNFSEMAAIYGFSGETHLAHMVSVLTQGADILHSQLPEFEGPIPVVVPVGADQDPHIRLTRDIASKMNMFLIERREDQKTGSKYWSVRGKNAPEGALKEIEKLLRDGFGGAGVQTKLSKEHIDIFGNISEAELTELVKNAELAHGGYAFVIPASTYHRFMSGLTGGKMSSSIPDSNIALSEDPKSAAKKIMKAKTGGRESAEEQRELGGEFDKCSVYELYLFHLTDDDNELIQVQKDCTSGNILCGECKKKAADKMEAFLTDLQQKREEAFDKLPLFGIDYVRK
ncbi:MAG: tryptophan--tRNA ligase [Methanosarcinales archaeon]|jgi:tryptophanyl-tRNA synthetase|nr:tryptophan--tRNA ligase [Methanosarcinales archaeon]